MVMVVVVVLLAIVFVVDADADAAAADPEDAATVCGKDATEGPPFEAAWSFMVLLYWGIAPATRHAIWWTQAF
jgi:hypothetical protein